MDPIVTTELPAPLPQRDPSDAEVAAARDQLVHLEAEARALGRTPGAAPVHYAMGRIFIERLGDSKSAAICYQNAFSLNPSYRPNLEAARRLFANAGRYEKTVALHRREEAQLRDPLLRAESLRAQATLLDRDLGQPAQAAPLIEQALLLAPDHPALLRAAIAQALREGDRLRSVQLALRAAESCRDGVQRAQLLRLAVLSLESLLGEPAESAHAPDTEPRRLPPDTEPRRPPPDTEPRRPPPPTEPARPATAELEALHEEAVRKLHQADGNDPVGFLAMLVRARRANDWEAVLRLCRMHAERTQSPAERALVASLAAYRLARAAEGLAEVRSALQDNRRDGALLALQSDLAEQQRSPDLADALRRRAEGCIEPSERAHLKLRSAMLLTDELERENLLSEALGENPGDAAAIALHARMVAQRDGTVAAERFGSLGDALAEHAPEEAAAHFLEAGAWLERAGNREEAVAMARKALGLLPRSLGALRLLQRTLPLLGRQQELAQLLEETSAQLPRAQGAELLARAAALLSDLPAGDEAEPPRARALLIARRAAEMARGLTSPRWLETWTTLAFRAGDLPQLSQALEARAESTQGADAADLLVEASELARSVGDDERANTLLRRARGVDPQSAPARAALLALPSLPSAERIELLAEEARAAEPERASALHAERAALLEQLSDETPDGAAKSRALGDEAVQACAQALALGGVDLAVLRRLARLQLRRGDNAAALAVLVQIAEAVPEGHARAEAYGRAAELAEWRVGDPRRATELYAAAAEAWPKACSALSQLARLRSWTGDFAAAADAYERLAAVAQPMTERTEARRWAASLYAHRAAQPGKAAQLLHALLAETPGDLEAAAELLNLKGQDHGQQARKERAELRGTLASRCQDPRWAALLRSESAEDRLAAGDRDQGVAEYRRALALNPQDRIALDRVEEALRASNQKALLIEHLAFRCAFADGDTKTALWLEQADLFVEDRNLEAAAAAYQQALATDPDSLLAVKGARHLAELTGDKHEVMRLLAREASLSHDPTLAAGSLVEAALLAVDLGENNEAVVHLTTVLEHDPDNADAAVKLRGLLPDPSSMIAIFEKVGAAHKDPRLGAAAWAHAALIRLRELDDREGAFGDAGTALARDPHSFPALELRADAAEALGHTQEAAEAMSLRLQLSHGDAREPEWKLRLGRLYASLGEVEKALPLLSAQFEQLDPSLLLKLAPGARALGPQDAVRFYQRLLAVFPAADGATHEQLAAWADELSRTLLALGRHDEALVAFRRAVALDPHNRVALRHLADLAASSAPEEAIAAHRALLELTPPPQESLQKLVELFSAVGQPDAAFSAAAVLSGLNLASPAEKALYEAAAAKPPPAELPQLTEGPALHAAEDQGAVRELLAAAAPLLSRALATELVGRGALVKGDNPVRRVVSAISRALAMAEPPLFLARAEPAVVLAVSTEPPGLLVGAEVPKRFSPRQQRFLYARALAHIRRGTQALSPLAPARLAALTAELIRLCAPAGTDLSRLPLAEAAFSALLAAQLTPEAREGLAPLAAQALAELPSAWEPLSLALRESAERTGLAVCADPAAAIGLVSGECPGGLERPEVARLLRFAVSPAYLALRPR
jgi:tetratricopeptide (TPR) repeat protein